MFGLPQNLYTAVLCKEMIMFGVQFNNELDISFCRRIIWQDVNFCHQSVFTTGNFTASFPCSIMLSPIPISAVCLMVPKRQCSL